MTSKIGGKQHRKYLPYAFTAQARSAVAVNLKELVVNGVVFSESVVEESAFVWLKPLGCAALLDPEIAPDASLCDTLLPKLISGELRVKDAERGIENVQ